VLKLNILAIFSGFPVCCEFFGLNHLFGSEWVLTWELVKVLINFHTSAESLPHPRN